MTRDRSWVDVTPVIEPEVRVLCGRPYPNHPKGCPNIGRPSCPPRAPLLGETLDLTKDVWAVFHEVDFYAHTSRMRKKYPEWSKRQVECCLYWQSSANAQLRKKVAAFLESNPYGLIAVMCPEAQGVNMTKTMKPAGIELEWPPVYLVYKIALIGYPKGG